MVWEPIKLNDGRKIPSIAFGTWKIPNDAAETQVSQAVDVGFHHVDTAQSYRNEYEAGLAIKASGLPRDKIFITTKFSFGERGIRASVQDSLTNLGVSYIDLYLIHHPVLAKPDIPSAWKIMEEIQAEGLVKSIGVSNFAVADLATLLASARVKPAANQILLHPYVLLQQLPILEYCKKEGIVVEAYSALIPLTQRPGGPVDTPVNSIASDYGVEPEQVLLAWVKSKGAVVVTTSSKKTRLEGYLNAGDLDLKKKEIAAIDAAGIAGVRHDIQSLTEESIRQRALEEEARRQDQELLRSLARAGLIDLEPVQSNGYHRLASSESDAEKGHDGLYIFEDPALEAIANRVALRLCVTILMAGAMCLGWIAFKSLTGRQ